MEKTSSINTKISSVSEIQNFFSNDIIDALNNGRKFNRFGKIYSFTNENINSYYTHFNIPLKRVLTVAASGDHMLNAYFHGAAQVDCFDINIISSFYAELKLESLKSLSFEEFKNFFLRGGLHILSYELYKKISTNLSIETKYFFDTLYKYFGYDGLAIRESDVFNKNNDLDEIKIKNNSYLQDEDHYMVTQNNIQNKSFHFFDTDLYSLSELLKNECYDLIFTSNISDYIHKDKQHMNYLLEYRESVCVPLLKNINTGGSLIFGYLNDMTNPIQQMRNLLYLEEERKKIFKGSGYGELIFDSSNSNDENALDSIIYITKNKL